MRKTNRERLTVAFTRMRVKGLIARQNFSCCGGCACSEMGDLLEARDDRVGAAYYHRQDGNDLRRGAEGVWIGHGPREGGPRTALGILVCEALMEAGLGFEWPGDPDIRIYALLPGGIDAEAPAAEPHLMVAAEKGVRLIEADVHAGLPVSAVIEAKLEDLADLAGVDREILDEAIGLVYEEILDADIDRVPDPRPEAAAERDFRRELARRGMEHQAEAIWEALEAAAGENGCVVFYAP